MAKYKVTATTGSLPKDATGSKSGSLGIDLTGLAKNVGGARLSTTTPYTVSTPENPFTTATHNTYAANADKDLINMNRNEQYFYNQSNNKNNADYAASNYEDLVRSAAEKVANRQAFSYDYNTDPSYQAYEKKYTSLGNSAANNTMGTLAANTGGVASSYAASAAAQANNSYMQQLSNIIPTLEQNAYNRYNAEGNYNLNALSGINSAQNERYNEYNTNRNFYYNKYNDAKNYNQQTYQMALNDQNTDQSLAEDRRQANQSLAERQNEFKQNNALARAQFKAGIDQSNAANHTGVSYHLPKKSSSKGNGKSSSKKK
jgi:hypothetical protein